MKLSSLMHGRDNNFNLLRISAAAAVVMSHSYTLALGPASKEISAHEPLFNSIGFTLGELAVHVFFITSGFLVAGSLLTRRNTIGFLRARSLRIFPGLFVMVALTVFALGPLLTTAADYFSTGQTYLYLLKSSTLIGGIEFQLPGIFEENPLPGVVNSPLWTLPREILMYLMLVFCWLMVRKKPARLKTFIKAISITAALIALIRHFYFPDRYDLALFFFMFFAGSTLYVLKDRVEISRPIFCCATIALLTAAAIGPGAFFVAYLLTLPYLTIYLAYAPAGFIRRYNLIGDYSYGVYIYGFPIQQSVVSLLPGISVLSLFVIAMPVTLIFAMLSWHLVERRALELKTKAEAPITAGIQLAGTAMDR